MSLILNIDTAIETASVCLAKDEEILQLTVNENRNNQAAWLHKAVADMLQKNNCKASELNAVAVSIGPGSYTGLRAGLAAAKGFCFALNIPLITVGTLETMAYAVKDEATDLICPMIDARRMEVFAAVYDNTLQEMAVPHALIIDESSFTHLLFTSRVLFCGSGSKKLQLLIKNNNAVFSQSTHDASHLAVLSYNRFRKKEFSDLAYTEPLYIKEFYSPSRKA
ncbi:MAG: tRNA (adenosine(37)-N6)-threonylcarbamoyltransferase complex dimerization subunit type 1 TsaB [Chitinophagaceae bacterium]